MSCKVCVGAVTVVCVVVSLAFLDDPIAGLASVPPRPAPSRPVPAWSPPRNDRFVFHILIDTESSLSVCFQIVQVNNKSLIIS